MVFYGVIFFIADWCVKTHKQLQVVNRREQCCAAPSEQCCQQGCSAMHDNNAVTALFNHQYCYNLLTRFNNNDNNNKQACSINIVFSCFNNRNNRVVASSMLNNIVETIVNNIVR